MVGKFLKFAASRHRQNAFPRLKSYTPNPVFLEDKKIKKDKKMKRQIKKDKKMKRRGLDKQCLPGVPLLLTYAGTDRDSLCN